MQAIREAQQETYKVIQNFVKNSDQSIQRLAEQHKETEKALRELSEQHKEAEKARKETEKAHKEMKNAMKYLSKRFGDMGNRFGEIAEQMVFPGVVARFNELGYKFNKEFSGNFKVRNKENQVIAEIDALLENGTTIAVVEVKTKPVLDDVDKHLQRIEKLKQNRREQKEPPKKIIGAIAGAIFPKEVKESAIQAGLYVLVQSGDTMKFDVPKDFTPKNF
ncbi:MAG: DUF3782 domain-containing protein [Planctomycetaceae bacterium]|jgi:hypothetical protein|nr:DUF3782 domain-containing protein [Planctomycetaceae bacterium]